MSDFIGIETKGIDILKGVLNQIGPEVQDAIIPDLSEYLVNLLKAQPGYRYVPRAKAYPETGNGFFSDKQRRYVMARIREGSIRIPYQRTQTLQKNWRVIGKDRNALVVNEIPYAQFVQGDGTQSRHEQMVGWKTMTETVKEHESNFIKRAVRAANRAIKKLGLKTT